MTNMQKLEEVISTYKDIEAGSLTAETTFEELELDSLDLVDMAIACEDAFGVPVEVNENLKSIGDILALVEAGA